MALSYVNLPTDVYFVCVNHALSTDGEEIVGLLVGQMHMERRFADIEGIIILRRSDKRKDRVEISPEQLSSASTEAEHISGVLKKPVRVIGWYHSHPKLTVWPSQIDVNTQDSYQLMDDGFVGIILSVFNEDPSKQGGRIQLTCYQSQNVKEGTTIEKKRADIPVHIVPANYISSVCMKTLILLPSFLCQEENLAYNAACEMGLDFLTKLHNSSVYIRSLAQVAEVIGGPLVKMMEERILNNEMKKKQLQFIKQKKLSLVEEFKKEISCLKDEIEAHSSNTTSDYSQYLFPEIKFGDVILPTKSQSAELKDCAPFLPSSSKEKCVVKTLKSSASLIVNKQLSVELNVIKRSGQDSNRPGPSHILTKAEEHGLEFSSYLDDMKMKSDSGLDDKGEKSSDRDLDDKENKPDFGLGKGKKPDFNYDSDSELDFE